MPESSLQVGGLRFEEAIQHLRQKVRLPTEKWTDLWQGQHARAFVVAGATKDGLLTDLFAAVDKANSQRTSLAEFRKDFDQIVERNGWDYKGSRAFRTRTIYQTNLRTSYQAGRYEQMKAVTRTRPFWRYVHGGSANPRHEHLQWTGLVLRHDDPWWDTHYPPNGWGCSCTVQTLNERDLKRLGKEGPDTAPPIEMRTWKNPATGEEVFVPRGIDPGWAYNVGEAASGRVVPYPIGESRDEMEPMTRGDWQSLGRPQRIPVDPPKARLGPETTTRGELESVLRNVLGGDQKVFTYRAGDYALPISIDARELARHFDEGGHLERGRYVPFIPELLEDPFEVWLSFERNRRTGRVHLRQRFVKAVDTGAKEGLFFVLDATRGQLAEITFVPATRASYLKKVRRGRLLWARS